MTVLTHPNDEPVTHYRHNATGQVVSLQRQTERSVMREAVGRELHGRQKRRFLKALRRAETQETESR